MIPSVGRMVLYRLPDLQGAPRWRPAVILQVHVHANGGVPVVIGVDLYPLTNPFRDVGIAGALQFVNEGTGIGEWRWPPRINTIEDLIDSGLCRVHG